MKDLKNKPTEFISNENVEKINTIIKYSFFPLLAILMIFNNLDYLLMDHSEEEYDVFFSSSNKKY